MTSGPAELGEGSVDGSSIGQHTSMQDEEKTADPFQPRESNVVYHFILCRRWSRIQLLFDLKLGFWDCPLLHAPLCFSCR